MGIEPQNADRQIGIEKRSMTRKTIKQVIET
jgi:hypothetical protein